MASPRGIFDKQIGGIIKDLIGDDTLKEIFEQPENHAEFIKENEAGTPSGIIAIKLGIIDGDTKSALLVAQAGERMIRRCEAIQELASGQAAGVEEGLAVPDDHKDFKFVGDPRDPKILHEAQAGWQISQMMLNEASKASMRLDQDALDNLASATAGFQTLAAGYVNDAAKVLKDKGFTDAAAKAHQAAQDISNVDLGQGQNTPYAAIEIMRKTEIRADKRTPESLQRIELCGKLSVLTQGQASAPAQTATAKASGPAQKPAAV